VSDGETVALADLDRAVAGTAPLPRDNGELVFEEPWQGRALGMGVVLLQRLGVTPPEFRRYLVAAIAVHPPGDESAAGAYYIAWLDALETLLACHGVIPSPAGPGAMI
jgi:hypothetical protein